MCLTSGIETTGDVCITGDGDPLTNWGDGVVMALTCPSQDPKLYQVDVLFPAGSNPVFEYKYQKDDCGTWESVPNRVVTLPTDGTTIFPLPIDMMKPFLDLKRPGGSQ